MSSRKKRIKVQRRHLQERNCWTKLSCVEKTKSGTKQSEDLHRFCWLHFGKEVLAESLTSHWDASSCKRLSSTYVSLGLNPFTTQSYLDILQPLAKYEARMGDLIGNNDGSTNSPCRLQTSSGNNSFTGFHDFKLVLRRINPT